MGEQGGGHFDRYNALIENGWPAVLTRTQINLWHAYEKHADNATGIAYPDARTVGGLIGHVSAGHVGRTRDELAAYKLIEVLDTGGGRGKRCRVRVLVPPPAPPKEKRSGSGNVWAKRSQSGAENVPNFEEKRSQSGAPYKEEQPKEQPSEQPIARAADAAAGAGPEKPVESKPKRRKTKDRVLTPEQTAAWREFTDDWKFVLWPKYHDGVVYDFKPVDGKKSLEVMRDPRFYFNAKVAIALAELFMRDPEIYGNWDHTMSRFAQKRGWYHRLYLRRQREGSNHVITAASGVVGADATRNPYAVPVRRPRAAGPGAGGPVGGGGAIAAG